MLRNEAIVGSLGHAGPELLKPRGKACKCEREASRSADVFAARTRLEHCTIDDHIIEPYIEIIDDLQRWMALVVEGRGLSIQGSKYGP